jgi:hypothetical protein
LVVFAQGSVDVVYSELRAVLPSDVAEAAIEVLQASGVDDSFKVRRELVNYKKVCLNLSQKGLELDRELRQLSTFFRDRQQVEGYYTHSKMRTELNDALSGCKGTLGVVNDLRMFVKSVCCLPRHPARPRSTNNNPFSQPMKHIRKFLLGAQLFLAEHQKSEVDGRQGLAAPGVVQSSAQKVAVGSLGSAVDANSKTPAAGSVVGNGIEESVTSAGHQLVLRQQQQLTDVAKLE